MEQTKEQIKENQNKENPKRELEEKLRKLRTHTLRNKVELKALQAKQRYRFTKSGKTKRS